MNLWKVDYNAVFRASSGNIHYETRKQIEGAYVVTLDQDLSQVDRVVRKSLGNQTQLTALTKATWLGTVLNSSMLLNALKESGSMPNILADIETGEVQGPPYNPPIDPELWKVLDSLWGATQSLYEIAGDLLDPLDDSDPRLRKTAAALNIVKDILVEWRSS